MSTSDFDAGAKPVVASRGSTELNSDHSAAEEVVSASGEDVLSKIETVGARINRQLVLFLDVLNRLKMDVENERRDYYSVRKRILFLHGFLNDPSNGHHVVAPPFRPLIALERFDRSSIGELIFKDQLRVDLHWLACSDLAVYKFGNTDSADQTLSALYLDGINVPEVDAFLRESPTMDSRISDIGVTRPLQLECIWICEEELRKRRADLFKERDAHFRQLQDRLRTATNAGEISSLSRVDLKKVRDVWLAEELATLMYEGWPSLDLHADVYRSITGDSSGTGDSMRNQRKQADRYIRGVAGPNHKFVRGRTISVRRAYKMRARISDRPS